MDICKKDKCKKMLKVFLLNPKDKQPKAITPHA